MNFLYFAYQLVATFFLIMAGIAVANFMAFDLFHVLEGQSGVEISQNIGNKEVMYHRVKFGLMMWIGGIVISLSITFSKQMWMGYPLLIGCVTLLLVFILYKLNGDFFNQRWVVQVFGYKRNAYLFNFLLCMLASYWLFRRSSYIAKKQATTEGSIRDDILDSGF